jgi:hypothetical protein
METALLKAQYKRHYVKGWDELLSKLKKHGGEMFVPMPEPEEDVQRLLTKGRIFDRTKLKLAPGQPNKCHHNVSRLWAVNAQMQLVTGYSLTDNLWVQHSWLWDLTTDELIETTDSRDKYFGAVLSEDEAHQFACETVLEFQDPAKQPPRIRAGIARHHFEEFTTTQQYQQGVNRLFREWAIERQEGASVPSCQKKSA